MSNENKTISAIFNILLISLMMMCFFTGYLVGRG